MSTLFLMSSCSSNSNHGLSADQPVTLRLWHYYSGSQKEAFDDLVEEFNTTVGKEKGIIVDAIGKGSISNIANDVNKLLKIRRRRKNCLTCLPPIRIPHRWL